MKMALFPLAFVTSLLVAAGVAVALLVGASGGGGGGGGDTSTLEGYFQTLSTVQTDISTQYSSISAKYPQAFKDKQQTLDYLDEGGEAWAGGVDELKAIEPPADAARAHLALVQATDNVRGAFAKLRTSAASAADATALQALLNSADTTPFNEYGTACKALQTLADNNKVTITLVC
jgi:hypothetical protein